MKSVIIKHVSVLIFILSNKSVFAAETTKKKHDHAVESQEQHSKHEESHSEDSHEADSPEHEEHNEHEGEKHVEHKESSHEVEAEESRIGPGKGVEAASEELGIKLSPQATKNFEIASIKITKLPVSIPTSALLYLADDVEVYRLRDTYFKRVDFKKTSLSPLTINSQDLKIGDEIVINGVGFIRIAEIAAFGGAPEGHSH